METQIIYGRLSADERETNYHIAADNDDVVVMDTTILKDFHKALKQGWTLTKKYVYSDGSEAGGVLTAPRRCLSIRNTKEKVLSEKQLQNLKKQDL